MTSQPEQSTLPTNPILVVGTDTGVGKTWTTRVLARAAARAGRSVVAIKPVETGCSDLPSDEEDGVLLALASGQAEPQRACMRFRAPVAPPEAADREGRSIHYGELVEQIRRHAAGFDTALVEAAGGLLSPLTWETSALDLAQSLQAQILLVASDRLGTISHVLMALRLLETTGLPLVGLVLSAPPQPDESTGSNTAAITRISGLTRILQFPRAHAERIGSELCTEQVRELLRWTKLEPPPNLKGTT